MFTQMCEFQMCPELFAFYDLLTDMLLCNMGSRNTIFTNITGLPTNFPNNAD